MISNSVQQYIDFRKAVDQGMKVQLHGSKSVAVDRETWEEMTAKVRRVDELQVFPPVFVNEEARYRGGTIKTGWKK